jgi:class 3 adenylate cyclase
MAQLTDKERAELPDRAFAYIDSKGRRKLPIHDASHVRNALARFNQVRFESDEAREHAMTRLLRAAARHGIVPVGFFTSRLRAEGRARRAERTAPLPSGDMTLLFADIEGSTPLLAGLGDRYPEVLERVRATIRRAVQRHRGHEVEVRADEYFAVFEGAEAALGTALAVQRSLSRTRWDDGHDVRLRIGLHAGRVMLTNVGYVGLAVHAGARVCAAAHGGQVLVSAEAARAVGDPPDGVRLDPLGTFRLAGLPGAHRLYQVRARGLSGEFPPPRAPRADR